MGCDCGCGGTCGMCAPRLAREAGDRFWEINQTAKQAQEVATKPAQEEEKKSKEESKSQL